ncbi:MAG: alanine--glyoxylate aminotransferase family protein [Vampirovibrionales bacterium]|nr:alanine--glyoxylate aminotransferase family protein [Vampirovibrionales bacterium]
MKKNQTPLLMIPGPTPLPDLVREHLSKPAIGHRSAFFKDVLKRVLPKLQWIFQTRSDVLLYTASGTGAMEAALSNTLNAGDKVLVTVCGVFSARWAEIAKSLGLDVETIDVPAGEPNTVEALRDALEKAKASGEPYKAVMLTHSETSTGILNPVKEMASVIREVSSESLIIVDCVTSLGATEFKFDDWGIDLAVSGSQKGFMCPPGLSFLAVSQRAWQAHKQCKNPGYYFNFTKNKKAQDDFTTAYTPSTPLIIALAVALDMMHDETLDGIFDRHAKLQAMVRAGAEALGLQLFVSNHKNASHAVTSILPPAGISVDDIRNILRTEFSIIVADGQKELKGNIFRIGHLGHVHEREVYQVLAALEKALISLGHSKNYAGQSILAAQNIDFNWDKKTAPIA